MRVEKVLFKELDRQTKDIFQQYNKQRFIRFTLKEDSVNDYYIECVDFALSQMDDELQKLIRNEYVEKNAKYWWMLYYSRTTYYRIKRKAMEELSARLKWVMVDGKILEE